MMKIKKYLISNLGLNAGDSQKSPKIHDALYLLHSSQLKLLKKFIKEKLSSFNGITVIDIGCGNKPYEALFAPYASKYIGNDVNMFPGVDIVSPAESIDLPDGSCDVVLLLQTLEHANDPLKVLNEIYRLLPKGGHAFITIPACFCYHPGVESYMPGMKIENPIYPDYWRWTQAGIKKMINENIHCAEIEVYSIGGFFQCFGLQLAFLTLESMKSVNKYLCFFTMFTVVPLINLASIGLDWVFGRWNRLWSPYTIFLGFAVVLRK